MRAGLTLRLENRSLSDFREPIYGEYSNRLRRDGAFPVFNYLRIRRVEATAISPRLFGRH